MNTVQYTFTSVCLCWNVFLILHRRWTHLNKLLMLETFARQCGLLSVI